MEHDPFDKIEGLGLSPEQVAAHQKEMLGKLVDSPRTAARRVAKAKKREKLFARWSLEFLDRAGKVLYSAEHMVVLGHLIHHTTYPHFAKEPIAATSAKTGHVRRRVVRRTLKLLEASGLADVEWHEKHAPLVRLKINSDGILLMATSGHH